MKFFVVLIVLTFSVFSAVRLESNYPLRNNNFKENLSEENLFLILWALQKLKDIKDITIKTENGDTVIYVERYPIVKSIEVEGDLFTEKEEIVNILGLRENEPLVYFDTKAAEEILEVYYKEKGFLDAKVNIEYRIDSQGYAYIKIVIKKGDLYFLGGAEFKGIELFSEQDLLFKSGLRIGTVFSRDQILRATYRVYEFYREEGFLESSVYFQKVNKKKSPIPFFYVLIPGVEVSGKSLKETVFSFLKGFSNLISYPLDTFKTLFGRGKIAIPVYLVNEGKRYFLEFKGNKAFSSQVLKNVIDLETGGVDYLFLENNKERIENFYKSKGFFDVKVNYSYKEGKIIFYIEEGTRYSLKITGFKGIDLPEKYDKEEIEKRIEDFIQKAKEEGYLSAKVDVYENINRKEKKVNLVIIYKPGEKVILKDLLYKGHVEELRRIFGKYRAVLPTPLKGEFLELLNKDIKEFFKRNGYLDGDFAVNINVEKSGENIFLTYIYRVELGEPYTYGELFIYGNEKTKAKEIYYTLVKQKYFSTKAEEESLWNLLQSENYTGVKIENIVDRESKKVHRLVEVRESKRGIVELAFGYNSEEKLKLEGGIKLKNLLGIGIIGKLRASKSELYRTYEMSFSDRFLFSRKYFANTSLFRKLEFHKNYDLENEGFLLSVGYRPVRSFSLSLFLSKANNTVYGVEEGKYTLSRYGLFLLREKRDNPVNPRNITHTSMRFSKIEGDRSYYRTEFNNFILRELTPSLSTNFRIAVGWTGKKSPIFDRFFLGGLRNMRGYDFESIGSPSGGRIFLYGRGEMLFQIKGPLWLGLYADMGSVQNSFKKAYRDLKYDMGTALGVSTPAGFIRLDIARPIPGDAKLLKGFRVYLSIGYIY